MILKSLLHNGIGQKSEMDFAFLCFGISAIAIALTPLEMYPLEKKDLTALQTKGLIMCHTDL